MFLGNKRGGEAMGVLMSLVQTCRTMDINALTYLKEVLRRINGHPASHLVELFPVIGKRPNLNTYETEPQGSLPAMYQQCR